MRRKTFRRKLFLYFFIFAAIMLGAVWLLETVFLQSFYNRMAEKNTEKTAVKIAEILENGSDDSVTSEESGEDSSVISAGSGGEKNAASAQDYSFLDRIAAEESLLILVTDAEGTVYYSADEHSSVYHAVKAADAPVSDKEENPWRKDETEMSWQTGIYRNLPDNYDVFLEKLSAAGESVSYPTQDGSALISGRQLSDGRILYLSTTLGAVGAAVGIIRVQLIWVSLAALLLSFILAWVLSRQFAKPVSDLTMQIRSLPGGRFSGKYEPGFCEELDELDRAMGETAISLEKLEQARKELLSNVSHDLRTPLTMIKGYAEMVKDFSWEDQQQREADLGVIIRESDRLTHLVNEILEYTSLSGRTGGSENSGKTRFSLSEAVRSVAGQFVRLAGAEGCENGGADAVFGIGEEELNVEALIDSDLYVFGNEDQLKRVIYNLTDNAVRHAGDNRRIEIRLKKDQGRVRFEVQDHGKGIPENELPQIWDRYFTSRAMRENGGRSGLGLAICREILESHGAEYGAESRVGEGSTFYFILPVCEQ